MTSETFVSYLKHCTASQPGRPLPTYKYGMITYMKPKAM